MSSSDTCVSLVPIFTGLDPKQQLEVAGFARPLHFDAGQRVVAAGDSSRRLFVVHSGQVRVVHLLESGREHVVRILGVGDVLGEDSFVLGRRPRHDAYADTAASMCSFDHDDLAALLARYPGIAVRMLQVQSERLANAERMLAAMGGTDVAGRLVAYLLDLPSHPSPEGQVLELPMAKKDVASHLGTTPETLSRKLRELVDDGVLALSGRRGIVIRDIDALLNRSPAG
ncbi:Crp/Fnr family transcriptional regulator [Tessaracoccus massiliensis]|uniref:Crp/Fnr family transcriptional regulator n=1 Tax=Tessaracoccus massiliensis TaxID=1522311 RepID=UPI00058B743C|nr:Crp/Fnr family transcriptional regulator [Tessaracoccus massiliensis]